MGAEIARKLVEENNRHTEAIDNEFEKHEDNVVEISEEGGLDDLLKLQEEIDDAYDEAQEIRSEIRETVAEAILEMVSGSRVSINKNVSISRHGTRPKVYKYDDFKSSTVSLERLLKTGNKRDLRRQVKEEQRDFFDDMIEELEKLSYGNSTSKNFGFFITTERTEMFGGNDEMAVVYNTKMEDQAALSKSISDVDRAMGRTSFTETAKFDKIPEYKQLSTTYGKTDFEEHSINLKLALYYRPEIEFVMQKTLERINRSIETREEVKENIGNIVSLQMMHKGIK